MGSYLDPYRRVLECVGPKFEALLWADRASQVARFATFASMLDLAGARVLDLGCGRGDFPIFLRERGIRPKSYTGVDALDEMVRHAAAACAKLPRAEVRFIHADFIADPSMTHALVREADVVIFCGSLNTMEWPTALACLGRTWAAMPRGRLAFNFLSSRAGGASSGPGAGPAFRFDPVEALSWALSASRNVAFRQDYLAQHDATITLSRA